MPISGHTLSRDSARKVPSAEQRGGLPPTGGDGSMRQVPRSLLPPGERRGMSGHHPAGLEIERWGRQVLTFGAAARRRAEAPSTSTMRSGNGAASDGPTCSPTTRMISIASPPRTSVPHYDLTAYERRRAL